MHPDVPSIVGDLSTQIARALEGKVDEAALSVLLREFKDKVERATEEPSPIELHDVFTIVSDILALAISGDADAVYAGLQRQLDDDPSRFFDERILVSGNFVQISRNKDLEDRVWPTGKPPVDEALAAAFRIKVNVLDDDIQVSLAVTLRKAAVEAAVKTLHTSLEALVRQLIDTPNPP